MVVNYVTDSSAAEDIVKNIRSQGKGGAIAVGADATTVEGGQLLLQETLKTFGKVDILVLNAGLMESKTIADMDETFFDTQFNVNVKAPLFLAKAVAPYLPNRMISPTVCTSKCLPTV